MEYKDLITSEEKKYLGPLENFFSNVWGDTKLPSHDLGHHRRVWNYAKELLQYFEKKDINSHLISNLLIACYLHDLGMFMEIGEKHGLRSRSEAEKYLSLNEMEQSEYYDALDAIENHDNKDYINTSVNNPVLKILSVADDLDAFGRTGIRRYLEIYNARGIPRDRISREILENAASRFVNFRLYCEGKPALYHKHRKRYNQLRRFFKNYGQEDPGTGSKPVDNSDYQQSSSPNR